LDQLAGSYRLETGRVVVTREWQGLVLNAGIDVFLLPSSPRVFFSPDDPRVQFEFDREGETVRYDEVFQRRKDVCRNQGITAEAVVCTEDRDCPPDSQTGGALFAFIRTRRGRLIRSFLAHLP
jgi:hypothetical protein